ncbi:MAG: UDP-3-O-[3-hydroxymyristoyl] N-acetylglucosamine deacetylase [Cytophagales bacterium]|nr:UDP-3-O-[3-hydroxymyristoyl] N-acetylglucosamine deacetylase [Armatimonadota bacterium]
MSAPVSLRGVGIHTGTDCAVTIHPADAGSGVHFALDGGGSVEAAVRNVVDTDRCTVLGNGGVTVSTVEHLLSALIGLGITDARIEVTGPEIPILDGSARPWVEAIGSVQIRESSVPRPVPPLSLSAPILVTGKNGSFLAASPSDAFRLTVATVFDHPLAGTQVARFAPGEGSDFARDVAPARTFGFIEEVEALRKAGLALGGSLENAVVVYPDRYSSPLRFASELAYHKLLDVLGDLFLAGGTLPLTLDIVAVKPSHRLNVEFASRLWETAARRNLEVPIGT